MRKLVFCGLLALGLGPAFAQTGPLAPVEQSALAKDAFSTGFLDREEGALGGDLWRGASAKDLLALLELAPARPAGPSIGEGLRRVLLSPGEAPADATPALGGAKLVALARAGFIDEARRIESLASDTRDDSGSAQAMAIADILSNDIASACETGRQSNGSRDEFWVKLRVVCYAASNELDAAELALAILGEADRLDETDKAIFTPLAAGGKPSATAAPVDALHYAALSVAKAPVTAGMLGAAHAGVLKAVAEDAAADWPTRLAAARQAAMTGALSRAELAALFKAAPADAIPNYRAIKSLAAPERLRDKAALIAREIEAAMDFPSLYAAALLYADDMSALEGALIGPGEAEAFALALLSAGDAGAAEKWLLAAASGAEGSLPETGPRFDDLVSLLGALDAEAAARAAAAANVAVVPAKTVAAPAAGSIPLPPVVAAAAIDAAANGVAGEAALSALAASDAAASGDPLARAVMAQAFEVAGLGDLGDRRAVEEAIAATFPAPAKAADAAEAVSGPVRGIVPRLKPKRPS